MNFPPNVAKQNGAVYACQFKRVAGAAMVLCAMVAALPAMAARPDGSVEYARGRILVETRAGLSNADLDKALKAYGGKGRKLGQSRLHVVTLPAHVSEIDAVAKLSARPEFKFVELDRQWSSTMAINDPYAGSAWHLNKVGAPRAWDASMGAGVTIAILDSGADLSHPDLVNNLVAGYNTLDANNNVADVCGHGTAVAGVAAASVNNGIGVAGVAGGARIMPVRIAGIDATTGSCKAYSSSIVSGLTFAADNGARVANISYGGVAASSAIQSAANYMKSKGGLVFVSAGNNNLNDTTAPTTALVVVAATDSADAKASFSNYGPYVTLAAPGVGIWTTSRGGVYQAWSGTSFASPLAAGVAALMMAARPDLSNVQVEALLQASALDLGAAGRDSVFGYGRVDAAAAVAAARAFAAPADVTSPTVAISAPLGSSSVAGNVAVSVNATDNVGVTRVDLKVNGTTVATDSVGPFSFVWDSTNVANGMASLVAVAYDAAGNAGTATTVAVNVANGVTAPTPVGPDTVAPVVVINNPVAGAVSGTVAISVSASDNAALSGISQTLKVDAMVVASGAGGTLAYNWNTRKATKGWHTISATAADAAGNTTVKTVQVNVQ